MFRHILRGASINLPCKNKQNKNKESALQNKQRLSFHDQMTVINVATIGVFARTIGPKHPMASHPGASL
jgi:hypothetical protein